MTHESKFGTFGQLSRRSVLKGGAALSVASIGIGRTAFAQSNIELKASLFPPPANGAVKVLGAFGDELEAKTSGGVTVTEFPSGQMGPPPRQFDLVRDGIADFSWVLHGFTPGRFPLTDVANLPGLFASSTAGTEAIRAVHDPLIAEHQGVRLLALVASTPLVVMTREKPITSIADFEGLRVRPPSAVAAGAIQKLGGASVAVPPGEMGEALSKGVIDAIATTLEAGASFRLFETVKYIANINFGVATFAYIMNRDAYDRLPDDGKAAIDMLSGAPLEQKLVDEFESTDKAAIAAAKAEGVEFIELDAADTTAFESQLSEYSDGFVSDLTAKGNAQAAEVYAALKG